MRANFKSFSALCLLSLAGAVAASAGTITLTVSGADTGTITLTETGNNSLITAISGTFDGANIGGVAFSKHVLRQRQSLLQPGAICGFKWGVVHFDKSRHLQ